MNIEGLKIGFFQYLQEKLASENNELGAQNLDLSSMNIFMYQDEFEEYIKEEVGINIDSFNTNEQNGDFTQISADDVNSIIGMLNDLQMNNDFTMPTQDINEQTSPEEFTALLNQLADMDEGQTADPTIPNNQTDIATRSKSFDFLNNNDVSFDEAEENTINTLFGLSNDENQTTNEDKAKELLSYIDGKAGDLSKEDLNTLKNYIKKLKDIGYSDEEIKKNIMGLDGKADELSAADFSNIAKQLESGSELEALEEAAAEGIKPNSQMEASGNGNPPSGTPSAPANMEKNIDNMSISELEAELENAKAEQQKAKDDYMQELETVDKELADNINETKEKITSKEEELKTKNTELTDFKNQKTTAEGELSAATTRVGDIDGEIAELKSKLNEEDANTTEINAAIEAKQAEKDKLNNETIPNLQKQIEELDEKINKLETETIPNLEKEVTDLQTQLTQYEEEAFNLASSNQGLQSKLEAYNKAGEYVTAVQSKLETRKLNRAKYENMDMPDKSMAPKDFRDDPTNFDNLPLSYTLDGKEYHCVGFASYDTDGDGKADFSPDSWEEAQRYFSNAGIANIGKYGSMQCHNYSDLIGQVIMGDANMDVIKAIDAETNDPNFGNQDLAGKMGKDKEWNTRTFAKAKSSNRDEAHAIIKNELQNGRPAVINVNGHYVLAVGIADDGEILIWDSYNGSMQRLGRSSEGSDSAHRNMVKYDSVMVYADNYYYSYGNSVAFDYWQYVENDPEYVLKNAYK